MFEKIKKIFESEVTAFLEHAASHIAGCFGAEKSDVEEVHLRCRSTDASVDRHREDVDPFSLPSAQFMQREVNPSDTIQCQLRQIHVPARDVQIRQKTPLQTSPTNMPLVFQDEEPKIPSPEEKAIHEDKILDLSLSVILRMIDKRKTRGRLSRPFDSYD